MNSSSQHVSYNLTQEIHAGIDGESYVCQTKKHSSTEQQYSCISEVIRVWRASNNYSLVQKTTGERVQCASDIDQSMCNFQWTRIDQKGEAVVSTDQSMKPVSTGLYRCQMDCNIRRMNCTISAMLVHVRSTESDALLQAEQFVANTSPDVEDSQSFKGAFIAVLVILCVSTISVVAVLYFLIRRRKKRKRENRSNEDRKNDKQMIFLKEKEADGETSRLYSEVEQLQNQVMEKDTRIKELETIVAQAKGQRVKGRRRSHGGSQELKIVPDERTEELETQMADVHAQMYEEKELLYDQLRQLLEERNETVIIEYRKNPIHLRSIKTKASKRNDKGVKGIALLNDEIFIISQAECVLEVYDSVKLKFNRDLRLEELTNPNDAVGCSRNSCLYVVDNKTEGHKIFKIDPDGNIIKHWLTGTTGGEYDPGRLSITNDSNIIFAVYSASALKEYSPDGKLQRTIDLARLEVLNPWHALKLNSGKFLVIYGDINCRNNSVCEIGADGRRVSKLFENKRVSNNYSSSNPTYLTTDRDGSIVVADSGYGRVILYGSDYKSHEELITRKDGICLPTTLILDESHGRLIVGDYEKGNRRLLIFGIK